MQVELGPAAAQASDSLPSISSRRKKTQNQSPPSGNGRGPLQWGLTVTEALCSPFHPQLDCPPLLGESEVNRGWGDRRGNTLSPSQSSPWEKDELPPSAQPEKLPCSPQSLLLPLWGLQPHHTAAPTDTGVPTETRGCTKPGLWWKSSASCPLPQLPPKVFQ